MLGGNMAASLKRFMQQIAEKKAPGPSTSFTIFHLYYTLELLAARSLGRNKLAEKLCVGDGAVRTIISRLKEAELIEISKGGANLTTKGREIWQQLKDVFPQQADIPKSDLTPSEFNHAYLVRDRGKKVGSGIDQRDAAIIAGARQALVIVYKDRHLWIESVSDSIEKQFPKAANQLLEQLKPQDNDVIVVAGAESALKAKRGAFAATWTLINA
jgi:DNA-binding MarR family transcriptional regulator